jgi:ferredoxin/flavodoxin---NADP+ reductase
MAYVITQTCCKDASCVHVCPVDCIRPIETTEDRSQPQMLYIDPDTCVDCGACEVECPVGAIYYEDDLPAGQENYRHVNAEYFTRHPLVSAPSSNPSKRENVGPGPLRVAVVGTGPASCYVIQDLVGVDGVEIDVYERLPTPFGLIRGGVAPDHQGTKSITDMFGRALGHPRIRCHLNVGIGTDLTHDELMSHHHAVVYGTGAPTSRELGIPGEQLIGSAAAADFVGSYNGHLDFADVQFDLTGERVVVVGNGNVAVDVARIILMKPDGLRKTDIAPAALNNLLQSDIREVIIIGRRSLRGAAFSAGEFMALGSLVGVDVAIVDDDLEGNPNDDMEIALKLRCAREYAARIPTEGNKRIVFRFSTSPVEVIGTERVEGLRVASATSSSDEVIPTSVVLRSIGNRGTRLEGVPFDDAAGRIPNDRGRVIGEGLLHR